MLVLAVVILNVLASASSTMKSQDDPHDLDEPHKCSLPSIKEEDILADTKKFTVNLLLFVECPALVVCRSDRICGSSFGKQLFY